MAMTKAGGRMDPTILATFPLKKKIFLIHTLFPILLDLEKRRFNQYRRVGAKCLKAVVMRTALLGSADYI